MRIKIVLAALLVMLASPMARAAPGDVSDRGEYIARAGDCVACHSVPGGPAFSGGLKMGTPLGAIYATNITPDPETGIGTYTLKEFERAVRHGIAKDGHRLYPAMPYPSYAKLTDADVSDLYDFFMKKVPAAHVPNKPSEIPWPLNMRWPLAAWNLVFADEAPYAPNKDHDAAWNRGAYLVQSLEHCGACHTPRSIAWNEEALDEGSSKFLKGANLDNWSAPNLRGDIRAGLGRWSEADLYEFLKTGHNRDVTAFGSMIDVMNNSTPYLSDDDLHAMAGYLKSLPGAQSDHDTYAYEDATTAALRGGHPDQRGAVLYLGQCVSCHVDTGKGFAPYLPPLAGNPTVLDPDPTSLINIVLNASTPLVAKGVPDAYRMPQFRISMNDRDVADVVSFIREAWGNHAGPVTPEQVASLRKSSDPMSDQVVILKMR